MNRSTNRIARRGARLLLLVASLAAFAAPAAASAQTASGQTAGDAPRQDPARPGGLTTPERPPQCTPPNMPSDAGSPQPSLPEPGLTSTPVSPPDGGCELTELPSRARLQEVEDPALRAALLTLRSDVEGLARLRTEDERAVSTARKRIQRDLAAVSRAARKGDLAEPAGRCDAARAQCERACGGRGCCCCTATFVSCLLGP